MVISESTIFAYNHFYGNVIVTGMQAFLPLSQDPVNCKNFCVRANSDRTLELYSLCALPQHKLTELLQIFVSFTNCQKVIARKLSHLACKT